MSTGHWKDPLNQSHPQSKAHVLAYALSPLLFTFEVLNFFFKFNVLGRFSLQKIFCKYFDKKLIFAKEGFSGFPNAFRNKNDTYSLTKKVLKID